MIASVHTVCAVRPAPVPVPAMPRSFWFDRALPFLAARLFAGRVEVRGLGHVPPDGPVLFVARHRTGLTDGWLHAHALPRPARFMIAEKLKRKWWLRPLVSGIAVKRRRDGDADRSVANKAARDECRRVLESGGALFVYPEGTSTLDDALLPLQPGAARLAIVSSGVQVVPVSITYADPRSLGTAVSICFGPARRLVNATVPQAQARMDAMLRALPSAAPEAGAGPLDGIDAPVRLLATWLGRRLADDDTAVLPIAALLLLPLQLCWSATIVCAAIRFGLPWLAAIYAALFAIRFARRTERFDA